MNAIAANVIRMFRPDAPEPEPVATPNPHRERQELGPNQLAWCKKNIHSFKTFKRDADRAAAHSQRSRDRHGAA